MIPALVACFYAGVARGLVAACAATALRSSALVPQAEQARPARPGEAGREYRRSAPPPPMRSSGVRGDPVVEAERRPRRTRVCRAAAQRDLRLPVTTPTSSDMEGDFRTTPRRRARGHEAIDILAPRNTPVRRGRGRHDREAVHQQGGRDRRSTSSIPTATLLLLLRAPRTLRRRPARGPGVRSRRRHRLRRHDRQRAAQHPAPALRDLRARPDRSDGGKGRPIDPYLVFRD